MEKATSFKDMVALQAFCRLFAVYGIGIYRESNEDPTTGEREARRTHGLFYVIRFLVLVSFVTYVTGSSFALYDYVDDKASLLDFVRLTYNVLSYTTILVGLIVMSLNDDELSRILFESDFFTNRFHRRFFRNALAYNIPSFVLDIFLAVDAFVKERSKMIIAGYLCGIYVWQGQLATFCMYMQCEAVIRGQLQQLGDLVRASAFNEDSIYRIALAKRSIRHTVDRVNKIFGNFLLVYYLKMFTLVTLRIGAIILWGTERYRTFSFNAIFILNCIFQIIQIYEITRIGSDIIIESQQLERHLWQPRRTWDDTRHKALTEIRRVLAYREYYDSLLICDSFVHQKATTFTFLGTMFTCTAIILQFDCDILKIVALAKSDILND